MPAASYGLSVFHSTPPVRSGSQAPRSGFKMATRAGSLLYRLQYLRPADVPAYAKRPSCGRAHDFANDPLGTPAAGER